MRTLMGAWLLVGWSGEARACSCDNGLVYALPARDAEDVATSAGIFQLFASHADEETRLLDPAGNEVPLTVEDIEVGDYRYRWARPNAPLDPGTTYTVHPLYQAIDVLGSFTTGAGPDTVAPGEVSIGEPELVVDDTLSSCTSPHYLGLPMSSLATEPVVFEVEVAPDVGFDGAYRIFEPGPYVRWGRDVCRSTRPNLAADETWCFRARSVDASGNTSAWSEPACATTGSDTGSGAAEGCGCGAAAGGGWEIGLASLLALVVPRRRRV